MPPDELVEVSPPSTRELFVRISTHENLRNAQTSMQLYDGHNYVYSYNTGTRSQATVYRCVDHRDCGRYFRIIVVDSEPNSTGVFALEARGDHSSLQSSRKRRGIHPVFKAEVDVAVMNNAGPKKVLCTLTRQYSSREDLLAILPTVSQIKNRKATLMDALGKQTKIDSFADLNAWAGIKECKTRDTFFGAGGFVSETDEAVFSAKSAGFQNATLVLHCFQHSFEEDGVEKQSYGLIMTSRRIFRNVLYAVQGQNSDGVFSSVDGTYKLHFGGWVLVAFGTYKSYFSPEKTYRKSFVPWAYMFVRTEHTYAYVQLFETVVTYATKFFNVNLTIAFGSLDHAACIANAYTAVWPDITLLNCYPHLARKSREKRSLLQPSELSESYYRDNIQVNIKQMHYTRSPKQFAAISQLCLQRWRADGQGAYADWFEKVYLAATWTKWHTTSGIPGVLPNQNPLEGHNLAIKTCGVTAKRAKTGVVLNDSIPGVFALVSLDPPKGPFGHYSGGPLPSSIVHKAARHVNSAAYYKKHKFVNRKKVLRSMFFSSTAFMDTCAGPACPVTRERVERYLESKEGILKEIDTVEDINLQYLSLHEVRLLDHSERMQQFQFDIAPVIKQDKIKELRDLFCCDCKMFWSTGWTCSHVIAAMTVMNKFDMSIATKNIPSTKLSGGQRTIPGALFVDAPDSRTFSVSNLEKKLLQKPHYPHGWRVAKEFPMGINGVVVDIEVVGSIEGYSGSGGRYKWLVVFSNQTNLLFECKSLRGRSSAHAFRCAHHFGGAHAISKSSLLATTQFEVRRKFMAIRHFGMYLSGVYLLSRCNSLHEKCGTTP